MTEDAVRIIPLGGLGEIGKNMTAVEYRGKIVVRRLRRRVPARRDARHRPRPPRHPLAARAPATTCSPSSSRTATRTTTGALPFVLKQLNRPVYGSRFTLALIKSKLDEHGLLKSVELNEVSDKSRAASSGPFDLSFVAISHSVPDALSDRARHRPRRRGAHRRLPVRPHADRRPHHRRQRLRAARREGRARAARRLHQRRDARARPPRRAPSARPSTRSSPRPRAA